MACVKSLADQVSFLAFSFVWKCAGWYLRRLRGVVHPVARIAEHATSDSSVRVVCIPTLWDNYSYIIVAGSDALLVDPSDSRPVIDELERRGLVPSAILLTHGHIDHCAGVPALRRRYRISVYAHRCADIPGAVRFVDEGETVLFAAGHVEVLHTPGHHADPYPEHDSLGNVSYYLSGAGVVFTGDTLFSCGFGFTSASSEPQMLASLKRLRALPENTLVLSGHEYSAPATKAAKILDSENREIDKRADVVAQCSASRMGLPPTTIALECLINPFLRFDDHLFLSRLGIEAGDDLDAFRRLRERRRR